MSFLISGGGSSSISGSSDVALNNPADNQVLTYNSTTQKWVNELGASVTPDATGSTTGAVRLAGDLGGTATSPTVPGLALKANINSPTFTGTVSGVTKAHVGLANVDNTSDANKPVSVAQQNALDDKVTGDGITIVRKLTQAAYDAIPSKDPATLYVIVG